MVKEVAGVVVTDVKAFADAVKKARHDKPGEPIVLLVNQNGRDSTLRVEMNSPDVSR